MRDKYIQSQLRDVAVIRQHLQGADISTAPLWIRGDDGQPIPTYAGALDLAGLLGIFRLKALVTPSVMNTDTFPKPVYHAVVYVRHGALVRCGASSSQEREIAVELAFRNAVGQVIAKGEKPNRKPRHQILTLASGATVEIRRIDRSKHGQHRWLSAKRASNDLASIADGDADLQKLAIQTLLEGA